MWFGGAEDIHTAARPQGSSFGKSGTPSPLNSEPRSPLPGPWRPRSTFCLCIRRLWSLGGAESCGTCPSVTGSCHSPNPSLKPWFHEVLESGSEQRLPKGPEPGAKTAPITPKSKPVRAPAGVSPGHPHTPPAAPFSLCRLSACLWNLCRRKCVLPPAGSVHGAAGSGRAAGSPACEPRAPRRPARPPSEGQQRPPRQPESGDQCRSPPRSGGGGGNVEQFADRARGARVCCGDPAARVARPPARILSPRAPTPRTEAADVGP